jgi:hypothetical protein
VRATTCRRASASERDRATRPSASNALVTLIGVLGERPPANLRAFIVRAQPCRAGHRRLRPAALWDEVGRDGDPDPRRNFSTVSRLLAAPWGIAVGGDMALSGVQGPALPKSPLTPQYMAALQRAAAEDAEVATALVRVNALIDPPPTLLRPELVARVEEVSAAPTP